MVKLLNCQTVKLLYSLTIILLIFSFPAKGEIPPDFCISKTEYRLYELINKHRVDNGLSPLTLSISLSYVATTHVADLVTNHPDTSVCNLNSWSDKGDWTPCCHNNYVPKSQCILEKPRELTNYRGEGHELAYWEPAQVNTDSLIAFWSSIEETNDFLLNENRWSKYKWRTIGVGMLEGYAVIWVGELTDREGEPGTCKDKEEAAASTAPVAISLVTEKSNRYYVICSSYEIAADALTDAKALSSKGYTGIKVVRGDENYRVSLGDFQNIDEAKSFRTKLEDKFRNVWILNY